MFQCEPELFTIYHQGFSSQVNKWPINPLDVIIKWVLKKSPNLVIVDMGCGEAKLAQSVPNKVFSYDFIAVNDLVTACDMAKVPLLNSSVDIVVFCLSLMGTNLNEFLQEAFRILKHGGILKVAEVVSRFENLEEFITMVSTFGYNLLRKDETNKMFVQFEFEKSLKNTQRPKLPSLLLKPCLYKKR
ncbi:ribosomal RNA-processing protein 8-like [Xenia sp. Carnegie-2017]|uniref:ribosomal RNA-processing protein 8-like n=1 Tax=Xenia sp. Carnegie-2017 TaxID=2897299 RepID=UPI001F035BC7|nr:ribosomal RNA-processing protein 8-like [Xenia sp. Carnegie-2017]